MLPITIVHHYHLRYWNSLNSATSSVWVIYYHQNHYHFVCLCLAYLSQFEFVFFCSCFCFMSESTLVFPSSYHPVSVTVIPNLFSRDPKCLLILIEARRWSMTECLFSKESLQFQWRNHTNAYLLSVGEVMPSWAQRVMSESEVDAMTDASVAGSLTITTRIPWRLYYCPSFLLLFRRPFPSFCVNSTAHVF